MRELLRERRIHPTDIDPHLVARFALDISSIDQDRDPWLPHIAVALARAASVQAASVWALTQTDSSVVVLHQRWLADMRSAFDPPRDARFMQAMPTALAFLDDIISQLVEVAGSEATVLLVSPNRGTTLGSSSQRDPRSIARAAIP